MIAIEPSLTWARMRIALIYVLSDVPSGGRAEHGLYLAIPEGARAESVSFYRIISIIILGILFCSLRLLLSWSIPSRCLGQERKTP